MRREKNQSSKDLANLLHFVTPFYLLKLNYPKLTLHLICKPISLDINFFTSECFRNCNIFQPVVFPLLCNKSKPPDINLFVILSKRCPKSAQRLSVFTKSPETFKKFVFLYSKVFLNCWKNFLFHLSLGNPAFDDKQA